MSRCEERANRMRALLRTICEIAPHEYCAENGPIDPSEFCDDCPIYRAIASVDDFEDNYE